MKILITVLIFLSLITISSPQQPNQQKFFIVQISPVIDGKAAKPTNFTIPKTTSTPLTHTLSVSSVNFLKNVTIGLQLFAWYNGNWITKKPRTLHITERRKILSEKDKNMLTFMKYADLKKINVKQPLVLNQTNIYISYDPEGSLMTSQLEEPNLFIPNSGYLPVKDLNKSLQRINTTLTFKVVHKSDNFIQNKRALTDLSQIQGKTQELFPLIAHPINNEVIQPLQILQLVKKNLQTLAANEKKVNEKLLLISRYGFKELLTKDINRLSLQQDYLPIEDYLYKYKLTFKDTLGPIWQWAFSQPFILQDISTLQQAFLRQSEDLINKNIIKQLSEAAKLKEKIQFIVFGIWIFVDFLSYCLYSRNLGLSSSYGVFLNVWIILQLLSASVKIGFGCVWYLGAIVFFVGLGIHFLITYLIQRRNNKLQHEKTKLDLLLVSSMKNLVVFAVVTNAFLHLFQGVDITTSKIWSQGFQVLNQLEASPILALFWTYSQFFALLREYYYVLVLIPQIVLNFRLKNVEKGTFFRILMVSALCFGQQGLKQLDNSNTDLAFRFKQGILVVILLLQCLFYTQHTVIPLIPAEPSQKQLSAQQKASLKQAEKVQSKQQLQKSNKQ